VFFGLFLQKILQADTQLFALRGEVEEESY
jgi:hypothetical protein